MRRISAGHIAKPPATLIEAAGFGRCGAGAHETAPARTNQRTAARARGDKPADGPGYIELLDGLTHDTAYSAAQLRFHRGIVEHLRDNGLADAIPGRKPDPRPDPRLAPSKGTSKPPR